MKVLQSYFALLLFSMVTLGACHKSDDNPNSTNNNVTPAAGSWKVNYFFDKQDFSSNYAAYSFEFNANGSIIATDGNQTWTGAWTTGVDDSGNKFVISFSGSVPSTLTDISEDWHIISMQDTFMHFEHISGGNGGTRVLKFTKI